MRFCLVLFFLAGLWGSQVFAAGFIGPGSPSPLYSAAAVLTAPDDSPCVLQGHLLSKIAGRKERYVFEDASGQIVVKIRKKVFGRNTVTPETLVRIDGEVETDSKYANEVEVDSLTILQ